MPRFEKHDIAASKLPVPLDVATDELKAFVERQVREIVDAANKRAAEIEGDARTRAQEIKHEAERQAQGILEDAFNRAWRILDGIDLLESGVGDLIGALRAEMEGFAADLGSAVPAEGGRLVPRESRPPAPALITRHEIEKAAAAPAVSGDPRAPEESEGHQNDHAAVEEMIVGQLATMHSEGKSRSEAERFVMRFKQGEDYLHIIDRIYSAEAPGSADVDGPGAPPRPPTAAPADRMRRGFRLRRG
jgi:hypothetical protein